MYSHKTIAIWGYWDSLNSSIEHSYDFWIFYNGWQLFIMIFSERMRWSSGKWSSKSYLIFSMGETMGKIGKYINQNKEIQTRNCIYKMNMYWRELWRELWTSVIQILRKIDEFYLIVRYRSQAFAIWHERGLRGKLIDRN